jgi:protein TonB
MRRMLGCATLLWALLVQGAAAQGAAGPIEKPVWETRPPFARVPPEGGPVVGGVALLCRVVENVPADCTSSDDVPASYVEAAITAARAARLAPQDGDGQPVEGRDIAVRIPFPIPVMTRAPSSPPPSSPPPSAPMTGLTWLERPSGEVFASNYPTEALRNGVEGRVVLDCMVVAFGRLTCTIAFEDPPGQGFGAATLNIARSFRLAAQTADGTPTAGGRVRVPITWRLE